MNRSQASCDSDNNNNNHNHNDDWRLQRASEFESKSKFERNDDCSIVHDRLYRFWCVICLYYLAIFYTLIELWLKVRKWRGDNVLSLNDDKDALRTVPAGFTVMITGAERGIGWETAQLLLSRGCRVIVASLLLGNSTEQQVLSNLQSQISDQNQKQLLQVWHLDLSSMRSVCNVAQRVRQENVKINVLINNAGMKHGSSFTLISRPVADTQI